MPTSDSISRAEGHSGTIIGFLLLLLIGQNLMYPQLAYPLHGLFTNVLLAVLYSLTLIFAGWRVPQAGMAGLASLTRGILLYGALVTYVTIRNLFGHPSWFMGVAAPSTFILGFWVFIVAAVAAQNDAIAYPPHEEHLAAPAAGKSGVPPQSASPPGHVSVPRIIAALLAVFGLVMSLYAFYQYFKGYDLSQQMIEQGEVLFASEEIRSGVEHALRERRVAGTFGNPNIFGAFLGMILPCGMMLLLASRRWPSRLAGLGVCAALAGAMYLCGSRGGLLSAVFAILVYLVMQYVMKRRLAPAHPDSPAAPQSPSAVMILLLLCAVAVTFTAAVPAPAGPPSPPASAAPATPELKQTFLERLLIPTTVQQRLYYWEIGWTIFKDSPAIGRGAGMFALLYPQHRPPKANETRYAHNFAVQMAAEDGLIGLALYLAWAGATAAAGWRAARRSAHARTRAALLALLALFLTFHVNSLIEYTFYFRGLFLVMAAAAGVLWGYGAGSAQLWKVATPQPSPSALWPHRLALGLTALFTLGMAAVWIPRPMFIEYCLDWGDLFWSDRNFAEASAYYHRAYALAPRHPDVLIRLASEAAQEGKWSAEKEYLERAIAEGNPLSASLRAQLASWYQRQGQLEQALITLKGALKLYPNNARLHYQEAALLSQLSRTVEAREAWRRALDLGATDPAFQVFLKSAKEF